MYDEKILNLKAELARTELLPESDFTIHRSIFEGGTIHGVDRKPIEIARLKADIAYYETLATPPNKEEV